MDLGRSGTYNDVVDNTRTFTNDRSYLWTWKHYLDDGHLMIA
jgi:hypothetical protein